MKNEFSKKTRELFDQGGYYRSWESGRNWGDCLHHILGRVSSSPYNAAPLNNTYEHQPEGRKHMSPLTSQETIGKFLNKTKNYLDSIGYKPTNKDLEFIKKYEKHYITKEDDGFLF